MGVSSPNVRRSICKVSSNGGDLQRAITKCRDNKAEGALQRTWGIRTVGTEGALTVLHSRLVCLAKMLARKVNFYPGKTLSREENGFKYASLK